MRNPDRHLPADRRRGLVRGAQAAGAAALFVLAGCAYQSGYSDSPFQRSLAWFSYLNGDDLRKGCTDGATDRYRIVYNGVRDEQVRTYDVTVAAGGGAMVQMQVFQSSPDVSTIDLTDPLGPWRGKTERRRIGDTQLAAIREGLRESGFYTPPPEGTRVYSWSFFWLAAACENGRFIYNAWAYDTPRFGGVALRAPLMAIDTTGVPFNPPRDVELSDQKKDDRDYYELVITPEGISGQFTPF